MEDQDQQNKTQESKTLENKTLQHKTLEDILTDRGTSGGFGDKRIRRSKDFKFYGVSMSRTGNAERSIAVKFIRSNGEQLVIPYHDLNSPYRFDGKNIIELSTSTLHITIEGKGLEKILDYLAEHRLMWIKEPIDSTDSFFSSDDEGEIVISEIKVDLMS